MHPPNEAESGSPTNLGREADAEALERRLAGI
jgi:hypothetical protein